MANLAAVGRAPLNGAAFSAYAGSASASCGATATALGGKLQYAVATASAGASHNSPLLEVVKLGAATAASSAVGVSSASALWAGVASVAAGAIGIGFIYINIAGQAAGDAGATGEAIPNAQLGEVNGSATATGTQAEATYTFNVYLVSASAGAAANQPAMLSTLYPTATVSGTALASADPSRLPNGSSDYDYAGSSYFGQGTATAFVDETKYAALTVYGSIATAESAGAGTARVIYLSTRATVSATAVATVSAARVAIASAAGVSGSTAIATVTLVWNTASAYRSAGATGAAVANGLLKAAATNSSAIIVTAEGTRVQFGVASVIAEAAANDPASEIKATIMGTGTAAGAASALLNPFIDAPPERTMFVRAQARGMRVPPDIRTMRIAA